MATRGTQGRREKRIMKENSDNDKNETRFFYHMNDLERM